MELRESLIAQIRYMTGEELAEVERVIADRRRELGSPGGIRQDRGEPQSTRVVEYRSYRDGTLQAEERAYTRKNGSKVWRGPYWIFRYHEGGKQRTLYVGKTDDPEAVLDAKRG